MKGRGSGHIFVPGTSLCAGGDVVPLPISYPCLDFLRGMALFKYADTILLGNKAWTVFVYSISLIEFIKMSQDVINPFPGGHMRVVLCYVAVIVIGDYSRQMTCE